MTPDPIDLMRLADDGSPLADDPLARRLTPDEVAAALAGVEAFAWHMARRLGGRTHPDLEDIAAAVRLGFVRAAVRFDPGRGVKYITYAQPHGWQEGCRFVTRLNARGLRVPECYRVEKPDVYLQTDTTLTDREGREFDALDNVGVEPAQADESGVVWEAIRPLLTAREYTLLRLRYGDGLTLREVGTRLGVSKERVRQIELAAFDRIRKSDAADALRALIA